jgi:hypothetical protein
VGSSSLPTATLLTLSELSISELFDKYGTRDWAEVYRADEKSGGVVLGQLGSDCFRFHLIEGYWAWSRSSFKTLKEQWEAMI